MWNARNKNDLIIEVWEKLDCESVGAEEIEAIEVAVTDVFGKQAVESPMRIARLLADEGAELRHHELMQLYVERASDRPHEAALLNILDTTDLHSTLRSIRQMENLRSVLEDEADRDGVRRLRELAVSEKDRLAAFAARTDREPAKRGLAAEEAEWLRLWLQSPAVFENWVRLRMATDEFRSRFGDIG